MSIEKDIKILHKIISFYKDLDILYDKDKCSEIQAIEHILAEREKDKKRIAELEEENRQQRSQIMSAYDRGWIPKQKVKEVLEDIEDYFDRLNGPHEDMEYIRNKKKELLEDK